MPNSVENFLMTAFSLKMLVVYALVAVIIAVPTWLLVKFSRNFPPAITHPSLKSGVGGWLIVFLAGQVGWFMRGVWETFYLAGELYFVVEKAPSALTDAMVAVLPSFFALVFGAVILWQITVKRKPSAVAVTILLLWIMGPGVAMLQSWYFKATLTTFSLVEIFGWTIGWTLYLAVSRRVALTYGTPRGKRGAPGIVDFKNP